MRPEVELAMVLGKGSAQDGNYVVHKDPKGSGVRGRCSVMLEETLIDSDTEGIVVTDEKNDCFKFEPGMMGFETKISFLIITGLTYPHFHLM